MKVKNVLLNPAWREMTEVNDGNEYLIQNLGNLVEFVVMAQRPDADENGGILVSLQQLAFKKVNGKLYMRSVAKFGVQEVHVERVE